MKPIAYLMHALAFFRDRLAEPSTWGGISAAALSAAALSAPWSYLAFAGAAIAAVVPARKLDA